MLAGLSREASVAAGSAAKASLVGAKTVKGPVPESAVTSLPALSAVTRVDRSGMPAASSTMFFSAAPRVDGGVSTPLMTCTTPLVAATSAWMTLAFWTVTDPAALVMWSFCPSRVLTSWDAFRSSARTAAPAITWYSRMASSSLMLAGLSREALVGGSEDSEGTSARERGDELASCERSDESRQIGDACCEFDNVLLSCAKSRWWGEHTVDDMHNTVGRSDICLDDLGLLDSHRPSSLGDVELLSLEGLDILGCLQVLCTNSGSGDHMVLEDGIKLLDVGRLEQGSQRSRGQCSEGLVGGSEDSEGTSARERGDELASFERGDESRQIGDACCEFDDVLRWSGQC